MSLFSVSTATRRGYETVFSDSGVRVQDKEGKIFLQGRHVGGVYTLSTLANTLQGLTVPSRSYVWGGGPHVGTAAAAKATAKDATVWHQRYSHAGVDAIQRTRDVVEGLDLTRSSLEVLRGADCEPCIVGKAVRAPFTPSQRKTTRVLMLGHSDVTGPMPVPTPEGHHYLVNLIDDFSRFKAVMPIKKKGQAKEAVMSLVNRWENQTGERLVALRTDDGKEYMGDEFNKWLAAKGIEHQRSAPYMHQHNGVAERYNRTLQERMSALLTDSGLPFKYWGEAAATVTVTDNRLVGSGQTRTPYELFYGTKPEVSRLRVFGCKAWAYLSPDIRRKLDPRAVPAIFLGYAPGTKGYRVLLDGAVLVRRDVRFGESKRGIGGDWGSSSRRAPRRVGGNPRVEGDKMGRAPIEDAIEAAKRLTRAIATNTTETTASKEDHDVGNTIEQDEEFAAEMDDDSSTSQDDDTEHETGNTTAPQHVERALRPPRGVKPTAGWAMAARGHNDPDKMRIDEARHEPDWPAFDDAVRAEVDALWENKTWELVDLPKGKNVTQTTMLCARKRGADGSITKHKARYVARGDTQLYPNDFGEVWAPVVRYSTLRALLAHCTAEGLTLQQLDVKTAFLNGTIKEEIYIAQPKGYERGDPTKVCRLRKSLYGLKQAARAWYLALKEVLEAAGFTASTADPCLFKRRFGRIVCYILIYVDDMLVAAKAKVAANRGVAAITKMFKATVMGDPSYFLGFHIERSRDGTKTYMHQRQYVTTLLARFGLLEANAVRLPMGAGSKLSKAGETLTPDHVTLYQELVGALLFLSGGTRPDIAFAVGRLSRFVAAPTVAHLAAAKVVLRYLKGTADHGLCFDDKGELHGFCDADYAADTDTRRSTSAFLFSFRGAAISWCSKIQATVAASTTEAEYIAASAAAKEAVWLRRLCSFLTGTNAAVPLHCENQSAIALINNPVTRARTKHIDVCHHFVRDRVESGDLTVTFVRTGEQTADALTKPLPVPSFTKCALNMGMAAAVPEGEC